MFYYYTTWLADLGDGLKKYHSLWISPDDWQEFVSHQLPTKEFTIKQFDSLEELSDFSLTVGLPPFPKTELSQAYHSGDLDV